MTLTVSVNGVDLGTRFGWFPDQFPGWLSLPAREFTSIKIPGRAGSVITHQQADHRELSFSGIIQGATPAARDQIETAIEALLMAGRVRVTITDGPARVISGMTQSVGITPFERGVSPLASRIEATLLCEDPIWRAINATGIGLPVAGTRYTLPLGTAQSDPVVHLMGPSTDVAFILRAVTGAPIGVPLAFQGLGLGDTEYLAIDCRRGIIERVTAGVRVNGRPLMTAGTFPFGLDPRRGPLTAEVSSGSGEVFYRQGWR